PRRKGSSLAAGIAPARSLAGYFADGPPAPKPHPQPFDNGLGEGRGYRPGAGRLGDHVDPRLGPAGHQGFRIPSPQCVLGHGCVWRHRLDPTRPPYGSSRNRCRRHRRAHRADVHAPRPPGTSVQRCRGQQLLLGFRGGLLAADLRGPLLASEMDVMRERSWSGISWAGLVASALAWMISTQLNYVFATVHCQELAWPRALTAVATLAVCIGGVALSW